MLSIEQKINKAFEKKDINKLQWFQEELKVKIQEHLDLIIASVSHDEFLEASNQCDMVQWHMNSVRDKIESLTLLTHKSESK